MKTNQNNNRLGSIESTINAIENNLVRNAAAGLSVERKKAGKGQACKCMINIFAEEKPKGKDERKPLLLSCCVVRALLRSKAIVKEESLYRLTHYRHNSSRCF